MMRPIGLAVLGMFAFVGCSKEENKSSGLAALPESFHLATAPANPISVKDLRVAAASDKVAVVGRVKEFTEGMAGFSLADRSLQACSDKPGDECKTPWDYCCVPADELRAGVVNVEFRDGSKVLKATPKGFHGLDHLKEVVVVGRAEKDPQGNVTVVAQGVYVRS